MMKDERLMMKDDDFKLFRGFEDGQTDERTDICDCRVAFATEKHYIYLNNCMFSICLIALDRHHIIVNATRTGHSMAITVGYILTVWICAGLCALPIIPNTKMDVIQLSPGRYNSESLL